MAVAAGTAAVIGGGPAGLMAAEMLAAGGIQVDLYDAMPSLGRKFLLAGKGGLNITHAEPAETFLSRYGARRTHIEPLLATFGAQAVREWVHGLGIDTFVGTSGRVFPKHMKAAPLLRAWLHRLRAAGVRIHARHRWVGWTAGGGNIVLRFATPDGERVAQPKVVVLALGGGSWPHLGSDGVWLPLLTQHGVSVAPLQPANCGFEIPWSDHFRARFAGQPVKSVIVTHTNARGATQHKHGEFVISETGIEGGAVYALSAALRDDIAARGSATLTLDLTPDKTLSRLITEIAHPRGKRSMASHLQSRSGIKGVKAGLLREVVPAADFADPARLCAAIKALPLCLTAARPLHEAISSAGGVAFEALDDHLMLRQLPGVFCAGEMLDWEAPTGGYLLTACFASGRAAGLGAVQWLMRSC